MNHVLLKKSIDVLKQLRNETHNKMDVSSAQELDEIIEYLEYCYEHKCYEAGQAQSVLNILGKVLKHIPDINELIRLFIE